MAKRNKAQVVAETITDRSRSIDSYMEEATTALTEGRYFDCERLGTRALYAAWDASNFEAMARITLPLQEARRQRRLMAVESDKVFQLDERLPERNDPLQAGAYVIGPPFVAADARRLLESAFEQQVPIIAFAREPRTRVGLLPIVVVGPATIRVRVKNPETMNVVWCLQMIEVLTQQALSMLDETRPLDRQVDQMVDLLDTLPESELLHQKLAEVATLAAREAG